MYARATFKVSDFVPVPVTPVIAITTALPVGVATMRKTYTGDVVGASATIFTSAFDQTTGVGSYVAMESFEGAVARWQGTFNILHSASTAGRDRTDAFFAIVKGSGTGDLRGIAGSGGIEILADGTHTIWLDYAVAS